MKADTHPEYVQAKVTCSCGNTFTTALDQTGAPYGALQRMPSVLHRQAEARRHWRASGAFRASLWQARREGRLTVDNGLANPALAVGFAGAKCSSH